MIVPRQSSCTPYRQGSQVIAKRCLLGKVGPETVIGRTSAVGGRAGTERGAGGTSRMTCATSRDVRSGPEPWDGRCRSSSVCAYVGRASHSIGQVCDRSPSNPQTFVGRVEDSAAPVETIITDPATSALRVKSRDVGQTFRRLDRGAQTARLPVRRWRVSGHEAPSFRVGNRL